MHTHDQSCRWITQDGFFCHLAGLVASTGIAIVHWVGCINSIKTIFQQEETSQIADSYQLSIVTVFLLFFKNLKTENSLFFFKYHNMIYTEYQKYVFKSNQNNLFQYIIL